MFLLILRESQETLKINKIKYIYVYIYNKNNNCFQLWASAQLAGNEASRTQFSLSFTFFDSRVKPWKKLAAWYLFPENIKNAYSRFLKVVQWKLRILDEASIEKTYVSLGFLDVLGGKVSKVNIFSSFWALVKSCLSLGTWTKLPLKKPMFP